MSRFMQGVAVTAAALSAAAMFAAVSGGDPRPEEAPSGPISQPVADGARAVEASRLVWAELTGEEREGVCRYVSLRPEEAYASWSRERPGVSSAGFVALFAELCGGS